MKLYEAVKRADELRPNPFSAEDKIQWLSELDSKIATEVLKKTDFKGYTMDDFGEAELLINHSYTDVYLFYLCAMIDFFSRDYAEYNNSIIMFNSIYERLAKEMHKVSQDNTKSQYYKNIF